MKSSRLRSRVPIAAATAGGGEEGNYSVVEFRDDNSLSALPFNLLRQLENGTCQVKWSNGKLYQANVLFSG